MKQLYKNFPFKTNRTAFVKKNIDAGVTVPENIKNEVIKSNKLRIVEITLPDRMYHISESPITHYHFEKYLY